MKAFHEAFPSATIKLNPFRVLPGEINAQQVKPLHKALHDLRELNRSNRTAFLVELDVWPEYEARSTGKTDAEREANAEALLVEETAALLLSRILLLRFFEDYDYFHQQRYLCNGGEKWTPKFGPVAKLDFSGSAGHERTAEL